MATNQYSVDLAGVDLAGQNHGYAFFNNMDEEHRVLRSFYKDGLDRGEKAAHIVLSENREAYLNRLAEAGVNVRELIGDARLDVLQWTDMHVRDRPLDQDAMLASVENLIRSDSAAGYKRTRLVGHHMAWLYVDQPALSNLVEYEARLNHVLSRYSDPVLCNYDLSNFTASVAMDIMRTHPLVIIGGSLRENPFFVPSDQFLAEIRQRRPSRTTPR
jgi:hypothetical protein